MFLVDLPPEVLLYLYDFLDEPSLRLMQISSKYLGEYAYNLCHQKYPLYEHYQIESKSNVFSIAFLSNNHIAVCHEEKALLGGYVYGVDIYDDKMIQQASFFAPGWVIGLYKKWFNGPIMDMIILPNGNIVSRAPKSADRVNPTYETTLRIWNEKNYTTITKKRCVDRVIRILVDGNDNIVCFEFYRIYAMHNDLQGDRVYDFEVQQEIEEAVIFPNGTIAYYSYNNNIYLYDTLGTLLKTIPVMLTDPKKRYIDDLQILDNHTIFIKTNHTKINVIKIIDDHQIILNGDFTSYHLLNSNEIVVTTPDFKLQKYDLKTHKVTTMGKHYVENKDEDARTRIAAVKNNIIVCEFITDCKVIDIKVWGNPIQPDYTPYTI